MKKYIQKTIIFLLPILIIVVFMEIALRNIPNEYMYKKEYLDRHSHEIETLIFGSSHAYYGLNPEYFLGNTFNASHPSQTLNYDYEIFNKYKNDLLNLKNIVIPISYFTLTDKLEEGSGAWLVKYYNIYYGINTSHSLKANTEVLGTKLKINLQKIDSYYIRKDTLFCGKYGWTKAEKVKKSSDLVKTGRRSAYNHTRDNINSKKYVEIYSENVALINSLLEWCNHHDVLLVLFTPPAYFTYRQYLNPDQLKATVETCLEIARRNEDCLYINLLDDSSFIESDFYDSDHMREAGAQKLSKKLNLIIENESNSEQ